MATKVWELSPESIRTVSASGDSVKDVVEALWNQIPKDCTSAHMSVTWVDDDSDPYSGNALIVL